MQNKKNEKKEGKPKQTNGNQVGYGDKKLQGPDRPAE